jgi:hypothetical protein
MPDTLVQKLARFRQVKSLRGRAPFNAEGWGWPSVGGDEKRMLSSINTTQVGIA